MINFTHIFRTCLNKRHYTSALYIAGDKASEHFVTLTPHLDFEERIKNKAELEENIKLRKKNIDLKKYEEHWDFYKHLYETMIMLDATKNLISENLKKLIQNPDQNKDEIDKLKLHGKTTKDSYKNIRDYIYPVEETAALNSLSLPNILDKRTPHENASLLYNYMEKPTQLSTDHFKIANNLNLLHYVNPMFWFLKNDAALFEHAIINNLNEILLQNDFTRTVNSSFSRSVIVEACCTDYLNKNNILTIHEEDSKYSISKLHFVGNANLYSFMAYLTKFSIQLGYFPLKFFTSGKQYKPVKFNQNNLFNLGQYSVVDSILVSNESYDDVKLFNHLIDIIKKFYGSLGYHYQLVYYPADKLTDYESLHLSIQMYSSHQRKYIEVGYISLCGDYLSKRLLVTYTENKIRKYPNVIYCRLANIQKMLGCILEYNDLSKQELLSEKLKKYVPV